MLPSKAKWFRIGHLSNCLNSASSFCSSSSRWLWPSCSASTFGTTTPSSPTHPRDISPTTARRSRRRSRLTKTHIRVGLSCSVTRLGIFECSSFLTKVAKMFGDCSVTRLDDLLHFGQLFKACGSNYFAQIATKTDPQTVAKMMSVETLLIPSGPKIRLFLLISEKDFKRKKYFHNIEQNGCLPTWCTLRCGYHSH